MRILHILVKIKAHQRANSQALSQVGFENLLIFDTLPGVIACPNTLTLVGPTSVIVFVLPVTTFSLPNLNSTQLSLLIFLASSPLIRGD